MRFLLAVLTIAVSTGLAVAQQAGDAKRGQDHATRVCAECHAMAAAVAASPNSAAPSFFAIANTSGMTEMALAAFLFTPHRQMPDLIIPPADARDLIAYILSLRRLTP